MSALLAIDAGQTGIKVRAAGQDHVFPGICTSQPLLPQLAAVALAAIERAGVPVSVVAAGVSGLTSQEADAAALLALLRAAGAREVILAHDSTTSFLGALGDARGAVVAAGTGVVTLAVGASAVARVDGWGHLIADAGSGYWIGREALDAVMREFDGRGPATALRAVAEGRWADLNQAYIDLQADPDRVSVIASFAKHVTRLASEGDTVSRNITAKAGAELAHSVETALRRVSDAHREQSSGSESGVPTQYSVCAIGGVFRSPELREAFESHITASPFDVAIVEPLGQGIEGTVAIANLGKLHIHWRRMSQSHASEPLSHIPE
ncbi:N-acetylglucosamine kinase [Agromyces italicus]|uniref:N-acetylglucosamine kinase n=1 Tax=Agromyces italicus TaxID=279572 RepID=UPI0003B3EB33|nr:BadF/BadG/BcrA/BcrD ATPase family protein [Agromyces italicus]